MTHYSGQPRDQIFVKVVDVCLLLKPQVEILVKIYGEA